MTTSPYADLSRRERQIMDVLFKRKKASVSEIQNYLDDTPAYNSIRVLLTILEKKGHVAHEKEGQKYIYRPLYSEERMKKTALKHMVTTFFEGSPAKVMSTLLDVSSNDLSKNDLDSLARMIETAKKEKSS